MGRPESTSDCVFCRRSLCGLQGVVAAIAVTFGLLAGFVPSAIAGSPLVPIITRSNALEATTSDAARRDAIRSIPLGKLSADDRAKVGAVLANVSVFRRMPTRAIDCDPDLYLFLVRHPDVVVNIWEMFKISRLELREVGDGEFRISESAGATATICFVYQNHDTHVIYGEGVYQGPLLARGVKGRGVLVLKSGYVRETNGRYYVTSRMDSFLSIEPSGAEIITKTISPVLVNCSQQLHSDPGLSRQPVADCGIEQPRGAAARLATDARSARGSRAFRRTGRRHAAKAGRYRSEEGIVVGDGQPTKPIGRTNRTVMPRCSYLKPFIAAATKKTSISSVKIAPITNPKIALPMPCLLGCCLMSRMATTPKIRAIGAGRNSTANSPA